MTIFNFAFTTYLLGGQHLEQVTVRVAEVKSAAAIAMIDLHVLGRARPAAVGEALGADAIEDPVELGFADLEGIMVPLESVPIVEVDRQCLVDAHRREMRDRALVFEDQKSWRRTVPTVPCRGPGRSCGRGRWSRAPPLF